MKADTDTLVLALLLSLILSYAHGSREPIQELNTARSGWLHHQAIQQEPNSQASGLQQQHKLQYSFRAKHHGLTPYQRLRQLLQTKPSLSKANDVPDVPQCMWNDVREVCSASQLVYLAIDATPTTVFHRAATMAYDRNLACSGHVDATKCNKDTANRCMYWNRSCVGTDAFELVNWIGGDELTGQASLAAFTCKGTEAAAYRVCRSAAEAGPTGICKQLPGCHWVNMTSDCLPANWDAKTFKQVQDLKAGFDAYSVAVWGLCAGACYVRQAQTCQKNYNSSAECTKKPFCAWEFDSFDKRKVCQHRETAALAKDAFSQAYLQLKKTCNKATNQEDCEKPRVVPRFIGRYKSSSTIGQITQEQAVSCQLR